MREGDGVSLIHIEYMDQGCEIHSEDIELGEGMALGDVRRLYEDEGNYVLSLNRIEGKGGDGE